MSKYALRVPAPYDQAFDYFTSLAPLFQQRGVRLLLLHLKCCDYTSLRNKEVVNAHPRNLGAAASAPKLNPIPSSLDTPLAPRSKGPVVAPMPFDFILTGFAWVWEVPRRFSIFLNGDLLFSSSVFDRCDYARLRPLFGRGAVVTVWSYSCRGTGRATIYDPTPRRAKPDAGAFLIFILAK